MHHPISLQPHVEIVNPFPFISIQFKVVFKFAIPLNCLLGDHHLIVIVLHAPLKFGTKCTVLHPTFPRMQAVVEAIANVCKGSRNKSTHELLTLCGEGEQMVQVIQVFYHVTLIMQYESNVIPWLQPLTMHQ